MIDAFASLPHYEDHIRPIWDALDLDLRGRFLTAPAGTRPVIVAGFKDYQRTQPRPVVFVEHGAGQTYGDGHPSYSGGRGRGRVRLFLCPSERVAQRNASRYHDARSVAVGCPKLDPWHLNPPRIDGETVALSFHFEALVCPESRSAFPFYRSALKNLTERFRVIGHGHPRAWKYLEPFWRGIGIEPVASFAEVLDRAAVFVADNTSSLYEFASTDRPVVVLNAPWYRKNVEHGLRFWEYADVGVQCDSPNDLTDSIATALDDRPDVAQKRRDIVRQVYAYTDGHAAERAAREISQLGGDIAA